MNKLNKDEAMQRLAKIESEAAIEALRIMGEEDYKKMEGIV